VAADRQCCRRGGAGDSVKSTTSFGRAVLWIALAAVLLAAFLSLMRFLTRGSERPTAKAVGEHAALAHDNSEGPQARDSASEKSNARPTPAATVTDDLCGVNGPGRLRAGKETMEQHVSRLTQGAISQWQTALAGSDDPTRQAVGLALANAQPLPTFGDQPSKDTPANNNLVLLAMESNDPAVYALALGQCWDADYAMASGPCQGLSWEHWANIDPDNGMPWLWIAARDSRGGDQNGVEQALAKASTAKQLQSYEARLSATALAALPGEITPLEKAVAGADVTSMVRIATPMALISLCSDSAIQQPVRKAQCSAIASAVATQGSTFIELVIASRLYDQLDFPQDQRAALATEAKNARAVVQTYYPWFNSQGGGSGFGCGFVVRYDSFIDALQTARGSDRAALAVVSRSLQQH
jgi:hypothetical protein